MASIPTRNITTSSRLATLPRGTVFLDRLRLLNPFLWLGVGEIFCELGYLNSHLLVEVIARITLPALLLATTSVASPSAAIIPLALVSPWSYGTLQTILPQIRHVATAVHDWQTLRCPALPEAIEELEYRIQTGRAIRYRRYDLYTPPAATPIEGDESQHPSSSSTKGIVLIPGALVEHASYSTIAGRLADAGMVVLVVSLEPTRVATSAAGADARPVLRMMRSYPTVKEWILVGHSQGTVRALCLPGELVKLTQRRSTMTISKVVLWARGNAPISTTAKHVLVIQGEKDPFLLKFGDRRAVVQSLKESSSFSSISREMVLPGASHQQFASYHKVQHPVQAGQPLFLDQATMSRQAQLDLVANLTVQFCFES